MFDVFQLQYTDVRDLGHQVLALGTARSAGTESGIENEVPVAVVADFRDGLVTRWTDYGEKDKALAAVGLAK